MPNFDFSRHQKPKAVDARLELTTVSKQHQHPITLQPPETTRYITIDPLYPTMDAVIGLEDGTILHGTGFSSECEVCRELVFTTQFTGYEEALTDQSYKFHHAYVPFSLVIVKRYIKIVHKCQHFPFVPL